MDGIFKVDPSTKNIQEEILKILKYFHDFCEIHEIKYILDYGTLLGAVRHEGFIPWDDDIDVAMTRKDFEKFTKLYNNNNHTYFLQTHESDRNYYYPFPKIRKKDSNYTETVLAHFDIVHGPWIDIFVYDSLDQDAIENQSKIFEFSKSIKFINFITPVIYPVNFPKQNLFKTTIKKIVIKSLKISQRMKYRGVVMRYLDSKYDRMKKIILTNNNNGSSDMMFTYSFNPQYSKNIKEFTLKRDNFENRILVQFENTQLYIPKDYHEVLENRYGDYMVIPPENERKTHSTI